MRLRFGSKSTFTLLALQMLWQENTLQEVYISHRRAKEVYYSDTIPFSGLFIFNKQQLQAAYSG